MLNNIVVMQVVKRRLDVKCYITCLKLIQSFAVLTYMHAFRFLKGPI